MKFLTYFCYLICLVLLSACQNVNEPEVTESITMSTIRIATFNVSMEANNYQTDKTNTTPITALKSALTNGKHRQIRNIAEIIQRTRPEIILLNEFDYIENPEQGINQFITQYLQVSQKGEAAIDYPHLYLAPVNTGVKTPIQAKGTKLTHYGFGHYPGQYGMVLLSQYPIDKKNIRTFQKFLWQDMPDHMMPVDENGNSWYSEHEQNIMRLSSKSLWDVPVNLCGQTIHLLASHPTPPVFDGTEDRNGRRNHDEIRFWRDYIEGNNQSYHYDDKNQRGGIKDTQPFVILGDLNASSLEGDAHPNAISQLLNHEKINNYSAPKSKGGLENKPNSQHAATHTAAWGMRADYVLPSNNLVVKNSGVFWPTSEEETVRLVEDRAASSDHRLVWADVEVPTNPECSSGK